MDCIDFDYSEQHEDVRPVKILLIFKCFENLMLFHMKWEGTVKDCNKFSGIVHLCILSFF